MDAGDGPGVDTHAPVNEEWIRLSVSLRRLALGYGLTGREKEERQVDLASIRSRLALALDREAVLMDVVIQAYLFFATVDQMSSEDIGRNRARLTSVLSDAMNVETPIVYEAGVAAMRAFIEGVAKEPCACSFADGCVPADPKCNPREARALLEADSFGGADFLAGLRSLEERRRTLASDCARQGHALKNLNKQAAEARRLAVTAPTAVEGCSCASRFKDIWAQLTGEGVAVERAENGGRGYVVETTSTSVGSGASATAMTP